MTTPPRKTIIVSYDPLTPAQSASVREYIRMAGVYGSPAGECLLDDTPPTRRGEPAWVVTGPHDCPDHTAAGIRRAIEDASRR